MTKEIWKDEKKPIGFFGKNRDKQYRNWDQEYGEGKWRIVWLLADGRILNFDDIFELYVESYEKYFKEHSDEALKIVQGYSYTYDKTPISFEEAFNPYALLDKPDIPNQFHHVAINIALAQRLGLKFKGLEPLQVRDGKADQSKENWPEGWQWGPGHIPVCDQSLIPMVELEGWWNEGSIEDLYQKAKTLQVQRV
ncbi:hypothetical protein GYA19_02985 [Candidatus Beckwithbacteria bacterium]|nr:hypothetical protein [Candidatus Beckwithbacteria bacterium]